MELCTAMSEATSEHVVFFLTTSYIEALQHGMCASALPAHLTTLPLNGISDLKRRRDVLQALIVTYYQGEHPAGSEVIEAHQVFETALNRLRALNRQDDSHGIPIITTSEEAVRPRTPLSLSRSP